MNTKEPSTTGGHIERFFLQLAQDSGSLRLAFVQSHQDITESEQGIEFTLSSLYQYFLHSSVFKITRELTEKQFLQELYNTRTQQLLSECGCEIIVASHTGKVLRNRYLINWN